MALLSIIIGLALFWYGIITFALSLK